MKKFSKKLKKSKKTKKIKKFQNNPRIGLEFSRRSNTAYQDGYKLHKLLAKDWQRTHPKIGKECILCNVSLNFFDYNTNNPVEVNEHTC